MMIWLLTGSQLMLVDHFVDYSNRTCCGKIQHRSHKKWGHTVVHGQTPADPHLYFIIMQ